MIEEQDIVEIMKTAFMKRILIPAFNVAYIPMVKPVVETLIECESFGMVKVARLEIEKFGAVSFEAVSKEYKAVGDRRYPRLHLDHIPVIDEDGQDVDWKALIRLGLDLGYDSVMIDASRLPLERNIAVTREVVAMAHEKGRPVEGELGAVLGHEREVSLSYDEIYSKRVGFTDLKQASFFVTETGVDWLSVAIGNIHGAISGAAKDRDKVRARLSIEHLRELSERTRIPLVLHGGSGVEVECILEAVRNGITKINIGTKIRQAFERGLKSGEVNAQRMGASKVRELICDVYHIEGSIHKI